MIEACFDKVFDTQCIYRQILDAMARPGKVNLLPALRLNPPLGLNQAAAAIALTLLDSETGFCVLPADQGVIDYLKFNTGAAACPVDCAEFIITAGNERKPELIDVCCGTLLSPEKGATLIIMVDSLEAAGKGIQLLLSGPGINGGSCLNISGLDKSNIQTIAGLNQEYPMGVDVIYADNSGNVACVPRSSSLRWEVLS